MYSQCDCTLMLNQSLSNEIASVVAMEGGGMRVEGGGERGGEVVREIAQHILTGTRDPLQSQNEHTSPATYPEMAHTCT